MQPYLGHLFLSSMSPGSLFEETGQFRHVFQFSDTNCPQFSFIALLMHTWLLLFCVLAVVFPSLAVGMFLSLQLSSAKLYLQCCRAALQSFLVL